jgi:hypothetical protein
MLMANPKGAKRKGVYVVFFFVGLTFLIIGLAVHLAFIPIGSAFIAIWLAGMTKASEELEETPSDSEKE